MIDRLKPPLVAEISRTICDPGTRSTKRIVKHRNSLTTLLHKPQVDGANHAAERALRPAVVVRKITGGIRSPRIERVKNLLPTLRRQTRLQLATWR